MSEVIVKTENVPGTIVVLREFIPTLDTLRRLAKALKVTVGELVE